MRKLVSAIIILIVFSFAVGLFVFNQNKEIQNPVIVEQESILIPNISVERIFNEDKSWIATLSAENVRTLIVTGDIIPARTVNTKTLDNGDFAWGYKNTFELLRNADLTFINLETPIIENCPRTDSGMIFCGDARHVEGLKFAGVDVANLGNNHAGNQGQAGVDETVRILRDNNIVSVGAKNNPQYVDVRGIKFAFLGYSDLEPNPAVSFAQDTLVKKEIEEACENADIVIVQFHWGVEYVSQPSERQKELGHLAIDSGADLVIGNHPHWIQPVEVYHDKLITYAHGNFIFDQMWSEKTRQGVVGKYTFYGSNLIDVDYTPIEIFDYGQPRIAENKLRNQIIADMKAQSEKLLKENNK